MSNPLVVCALRDELKVKSNKVNLLYTGVGKINAAISITMYLLKNSIQILNDLKKVIYI